MTLTVPLRVLQPRASPGSRGGLSSPCMEDLHLFPSIPPFLRAWDSYREVYREVSYVLPGAAPGCSACPAPLF